MYGVPISHSAGGHWIEYLDMLPKQLKFGTKSGEAIGNTAGVRSEPCLPYEE